MLRHNWVSGLAFLVSTLSSPCLALDYIVPVDTPTQALVINRTDVEGMPDGNLQLHYMRVTAAASQIAGKSIHYSYYLETVDCKSHTFRFASVVYLDDNFAVASIGRTANSRLTDPQTPPPSSPIEKVVNVVCAPGELSWVHTDSSFNDVVKLKMTTMGTPH